MCLFCTFHHTFQSLEHNIWEGIEAGSPALQADYFPAELSGKPLGRLRFPQYAEQGRKKCCASWPLGATTTLKCRTYGYFVFSFRLCNPMRYATPWSIQPMEFSRPEYWRRLPFPSPGDLSTPGIKPRSPALHADSLLAELLGKPCKMIPSLKK